MSLQENLANAAAAVESARNAIKASSNKISDRIARGGGIDAIISARTGIDFTLIQDVHDSRQRTIRTGDWSNDISTMANQAIISDVGNCMELAAVAFSYLDQQRIHPIDYMCFDAAGYDHAWVVVGRIADSILTNLRSWGSDAVWCDPWQGDDGKVFSIQEFVKGGVRNLNAIFKCNTVELVEAGNPISLHRIP